MLKVSIDYVVDTDDNPEALALHWRDFFLQWDNDPQVEVQVVD